MTPKIHTPPPYQPPPADDLKTIHIDDHILVADKPSGLLSVPGRGADKAICAHSILSDRHGPVLTVHRLDMDTSGLIIFARTKAAQRYLSRGFERRLTDKRYIAVVENVVAQDVGEITLSIAKHSLQRPLRHIDPDGQDAITHWRVLERSTDTTRLELTPTTGRSHQLRLHLSAIGHPILGDPLYGNQLSAPRLLLHASALKVRHPHNQKDACFQSPTAF